MMKNLMYITALLTYYTVVIKSVVIKKIYINVYLNPVMFSLEDPEAGLSETTSASKSRTILSPQTGAFTFSTSKILMYL